MARKEGRGRESPRPLPELHHPSCSWCVHQPRGFLIPEVLGCYRFPVDRYDCLNCWLLVVKSLSSPSLIFRNYGWGWKFQASNQVLAFLVASPILQLWSHLIRTKLLLLPRHSRSSKNFRCPVPGLRKKTKHLSYCAMPGHFLQYIEPLTSQTTLTIHLLPLSCPNTFPFLFLKDWLILFYIFFGCGRSLLHEDSLVEASQGYSSLQLLIIVAFAVAAHGLRGCGTQALFVAPQHLGSSQTRESKLCPLHCKADS